MITQLKKSLEEAIAVRNLKNAYSYAMSLDYYCQTNYNYLQVMELQRRDKNMELQQLVYRITEIDLDIANIEYAIKSGLYGFEETKKLEEKLNKLDSLERYYIEIRDSKEKPYVYKKAR